MRLHVDEHGVGPKVCVLVHGMMGSAESWWRVTPELVEAGGGVWEPAAGSIVVRADPSDYVSDSDAAAFHERGVSVRSIPGAAHSVWYSNFDQFIAALPEVFQ